MSNYNDNLHKNSKASISEYARDLRKGQTPAEEKLWQALRNKQVHDLKFRRQHAFDNYILDFYCHEKKLAIEVDGAVHNNAEVADYDLARTKNLNESGITVLRFSNSHVEKNLDGVIEIIKGWVQKNGFKAPEDQPVLEEQPINLKNKSSIRFSESETPLSLRRGVGGEAENRLNILFNRKKSGILNIYCTAGYPKPGSTAEVMVALQRHGADIIEIGMPYSDPLADGPVIQQSNMKALENGMNISLLFEQLEALKDTIHIPVILMGYLNPVMQYGFEQFCAKASSCGVDGIILPDLPMHVFETEYKPVVEKYGLCFIFLVTPETGEDRIRKIDQMGSGFIYAVSSSSTTGGSISATDRQAISNRTEYIRRLQDMHLEHPVLVGFGISDKESFDAASKYANGAIIGSAYIRALEHTTDIDQTTKEFLNAVTG